MENQINIAEILKSKPKGTKLYSPIFGDVTFDKIEKDLGEYTIFVTDKGQNHQTFMADGRYNRNGVPVLFPSKEMRDWSKFAWKKGDVLVIYEGWNAGLFAGFANEDYTKINLAHYYERRIDGENVYIKKATFNTDDFDIDILDSAEKYISAIEKMLGGKLNMETFGIEKPKWTPKPFDKVLVRDCNEDEWRAALFSHVGRHGEFVTTGYSFKYVIPYNEKTAKLIGTTDNWEG